MPWYRAFQALSRSRPMGMAGPMPITIVDIDAYCRITAVEPEQRQAFLRLIQQIDSDYLRLMTPKTGA